MKIKLIIIYFFFLSSTACFSQLIIAGQISSGVIYNDITPDIDLNASPSNLPGDTTVSKSIDLNQDGINDFTFSARGGAGTSHSIWTSRISPIGNNQVSFSRGETKYNPASGSTTTVFVANGFSPGDTITNDASFISSYWRALNYEYSLTGSGSFSIHDWVLSGEKLIGFKLITSVDTTFGWIRVLTPAYNHIIIKDYAYIDNQLVNYDGRNSDFSLVIYPNPAKEQITISYTKCLTGNIEIYNLQGQLISKTSINNLQQTQVNLQNFPKGIHILKVLTDDKVLYRKFVVE